MSNDGSPHLLGAPSMVRRTLDNAARLGFRPSCTPETGRLLHILAGSADTIGEAGTGVGVGAAWIASGKLPHARFVTVEVDEERGRAAVSRAPGLERLAAGYDAASVLSAPFDGRPNSGIPASSASNSSLRRAICSPSADVSLPSFSLASGSISFSSSLM